MMWLLKAHIEFALCSPSVRRMMFSQRLFRTLETSPDFPDTPVVRSLALISSPKCNLLYAMLRSIIGCASGYFLRWGYGVGAAVGMDRVDEAVFEFLLTSSFIMGLSAFLRITRS